jgi:hypothetical protein
VKRTRQCRGRSNYPAPGPLLVQSLIFWGRSAVA